MSEMERFRPAHSLALAGKTGLVVVVCPKCNKTIKEYPQQISVLSAWAYSREEPHVNVEIDGRGCCY